MIVSGHTVEQVLSYDIAEAEAVFRRPFDDVMDTAMRMAMHSADSRLAGRDDVPGRRRQRATSSTGSASGRRRSCTAARFAPASSTWVFTRTDGTRAEPGTVELRSRHAPHLAPRADQPRRAHGRRRRGTSYGTTSNRTSGLSGRLGESPGRRYPPPLRIPDSNGTPARSRSPSWTGTVRSPATGTKSVRDRRQPSPAGPMPGVSDDADDERDVVIGGDRENNRSQ